MDDSTRLLMEISSAAHTGINALTAVLPEIKNGRVRRQLQHQLSAYRTFAGQTGISQKGGMADGLARLNVRAQTRMNPTPSHVASMMMKGSEMGLIKVQKAVNHCAGADEQAKALAQQMMTFQQNTIDAYRPFL